MSDDYFGGGDDGGNEADYGGDEADYGNLQEDNFDYDGGDQDDEPIDMDDTGDVDGVEIDGVEVDGVEIDGAGVDGVEVDGAEVDDGVAQAPGHSSKWDMFDLTLGDTSRGDDDQQSRTDDAVEDNDSEEEDIAASNNGSGPSDSSSSSAPPAARHPRSFVATSEPDMPLGDIDLDETRGSIDDPISEGNLDEIFGDMIRMFANPLAPVGPSDVRVTKNERQAKLARWYKHNMARKKNVGTVLPTEAVTGKYSSCLGDTVQQVETSVRSVLKANITTYGWTRIHIESFNKFYLTSMPEIVNEVGPILIDSKKHARRHVIEFSNPKWGPPSIKEADGAYRQITPEECLQRGLSWTAPILADMTHHIFATETPPGEVVPGSVGPNPVPVPAEMAPADLAKLSSRERLKAYGHLVETTVCRETLLGFIPMMRGSVGDPTRFNSPAQNRECPSFSTGSFVITGMEKGVIPQENPRTNYCRVTHIRKQQQRFSIMFESRALHESRIRSSSTIKGYVLKGANPKMLIKMPFIDRCLLPATVVFRLIGFTTPEQMLQCICGKDAQTEAFLNMARCFVEPDEKTSGLNVAQLLNYIGAYGTKDTAPEKRARYVKHIFASEFFPQMGLKRTMETLRKRAEFFGYCIRKTINVKMGVVDEDDMDHDMDKMWDTVGVLNSILLRQLLRAMIRSLTVSMHQATEAGKYVSAVDCMVTKRITGGFRYFYNTGNFGISRGGNTQKGVCQVLAGFNMWCKLNHLRRVNKPICREGKTTAPRMLPPSSWGHKCPVATPEGESCGLVLAAALLVHVRTGYRSRILRALLVERLGVVPLLDPVTGLLSEPPAGSTRVMMNHGRLVGYISDATALRARLIEMRRGGHIYFDTTVALLSALKEPELHIGTDAGCLLRPLFVRENLHKFRSIQAQYGHSPTVFWNQLMGQGVIEYVSSIEESTCLVAMFPKDLTCYHTHCEIDPCTVMSVEAYALIMSDSNQQPRNIYASGMMRHSYGAYPAINYLESMATSQHVLHYPQHPITSTHCADLIPEEQPANVQNLIMAIVVDASIVEDAVILNKRCVDFGVGRCTMFKTYRDQEKTTGADLETFIPPDKEHTKGLQDGNYDKTDRDGLMGPGTRVGYKDILCNKVQHSNQTNAKKDAQGTATAALKTAVARTSRAVVAAATAAHAAHKVAAASMTEATMQMAAAADAKSASAVEEARQAKAAADVAVAAEATQNTQFVKMTDKAMMSKNREGGVVDRVIVTNAEDGCKQVRIRVRYTRTPEAGDKYAVAGCAQKGIISMLKNPEDMPFNPETGMVPDLLYNVHGVISRMTMSFIKEALFGKVGCIEGHRVNGTNYRADSMEDMQRMLLSNGFECSGKETLIDGETGAQMEASIFMGVVGYMRMKQMVVDKEHARPHGPKSSITRQPKEGRRQHGGIRFGEMEKDNMIDHGAPATLKDRICDQSDSYMFFIHRDCGTLCEPPKSKVNKMQHTLSIVRDSLKPSASSAAAAAAPINARDPNRPWCRLCLSSENIFEIKLPYACKLLFQELKAVHIQPRILIEPDNGVEITYERNDQSQKFSNQQLIDMCNKQLGRPSQKSASASAAPAVVGKRPYTTTVDTAAAAAAAAAADSSSDMSSQVSKRAKLKV